MKLNTKHFLYSIFADILFLFSTATLFAIHWARRSYPMHLNRTVFFVMTTDVSGHDSGTGLSILKGFVIPAIIVFIIFKIILLLLKKIKISFEKRKIFFISVIYCVFSLLLAIFILKAWRYPLIANEVKGKPIDSEFYKENYINIEDAKIIPPENKRNLIVIFMESMESSYVDIEQGGLFEKTPISHIQELAEKNINFSQNDKIGGGMNLEGTSWTVGGLISKLTAVPYFSPFENKNGKIVCLENAVSLTDILYEQGYRIIFSMGSEKKFENRDIFLESHHNDVHDINWYKEQKMIPNDYQVFWGFEDLKLYDVARTELDTLGKSAEPFCFQMLTVDTHFPSGFKCEACKGNFDKQIMNVLECADNLVFDFIQWIENQSWYDNTTIVILGDHCYLNAPKNNFIEEESPFDKKVVNNSRRFFNLIINPFTEISKEEQKNRDFSSYDIMPTILESLGNRIEGGGIALGRSLLGKEPTLIEEFGKETVEKETMKKTIQYEELK